MLLKLHHTACQIEAVHSKKLLRAWRYVRQRHLKPCLSVRIGISRISSCADFQASGRRRTHLKQAQPAEPTRETVGEGVRRGRCLHYEAFKVCLSLSNTHLLKRWLSDWRRSLPNWWLHPPEEPRSRRWAFPCSDPRCARLGWVSQQHFYFGTMVL